MTTKQDRSRIGERVRTLRKQRSWTQAQLAKLLGVSQNYLSVLERGKGSFTAEHLLKILKTFNVPVDYFAAGRGQREDQLQSALARFGAAHLHKSADTSPTQAFQEAADAVREALISAESARQITAVAPVIALNINRTNLNKLQAQFVEHGRGQRFGWALENTLNAIQRDFKSSLPQEWRLRYRRAEVVLKSFLSFVKLGPKPEAPDILDQDIASEKSLAEARNESSDISRRWGIVTRIQPQDFLDALKAAREAH